MANSKQDKAEIWLEVILSVVLLYVCHSRLTFVPYLLITYGRSFF